MITMQKTNGGPVPIIACDHCHRQIDNANLAVAVMFKDGSLKYAHKCCQEAVGTHHPWEELNRHLRHALKSAGVTPDMLKEQEDSDNQQGYHDPTY